MTHFPGYYETPRLVNFWYIYFDGMWGDKDFTEEACPDIVSKRYHSFNKAYVAAREFIAKRDDLAPLIRISMKGAIAETPVDDGSFLTIRSAISADTRMSYVQQQDLEWTMRTMAAEVPDFSEFRYFVYGPMGKRSFDRALSNSFGVELSDWHWFPFVLAVKTESDLVMFRMHVEFKEGTIVYEGGIV